MTELYSYNYGDYTVVTTCREEAEEFGITGILYGTLVNEKPKWRDIHMIYVGDIVHASTLGNYYIEKIIACK